MTGPSLSAIPSSSAVSAPVRVALVSPGEIYGGVERFVSTFAVYLRQSGLGEPLAVLFSEGELARELRVAGVPVMVAPGGKYDPRLLPWLTRLLRSEKISVLHAHGYKAGVVGALAARCAGIPAVKTEHGALEPFSGLDALKMRGNLAVDWIFTRRFVEETVYITADLRERKGLAGRRGSRVIPNGMATLDREALRRPHASGEFHIGIVGRLVPVKGHGLLLDAAARMSDRRGLRIDVLGTGPLEDDLRGRAAALGPGIVSFHGFIRDVLPAMASLDCLAMPSQNEGLPYTLLEAMHLGLPIVASRVGGLKEILSDGKTALLFEPGDAAGLAARLKTVMENKKLAESLGAEARADARARFNIAAMAEAYVKLYREVME